MIKRLQAVKGMPDILPKDVLYWQRLETDWRRLAESYAYREMRLPLLENTVLFKRSIGEVTDIVEKEMFTFLDRNHESITLRPEGTASCIRASLEHGLLHNQIQRLWYMGPMFRYEQPQAGRYRQFHQIGVEVFGLEGPDIEAEHILMINRFLKNIHISEGVRLQINTLGSVHTRDLYRAQLVEYFTRYYADLDEDCRRRLTTNPLRILDSKNPTLTAIILDAPNGLNFLEPADKQHFEHFQQLLAEMGIAYEINPRLVRGLDYYNRTVYEWVTDRLGTQGTVCAGGRFDDLVTQLGGRPTPGVGFALGMERVILLEQALGVEMSSKLDIYIVCIGEGAQTGAFALAESLRNAAHPHLKIQVHCGGGGLKNQFKQADKSQAKIALILGETELANGSVGIKFLRETREQCTLPVQRTIQFLAEYFGNSVC